MTVTEQRAAVAEALRSADGGDNSMTDPTPESRPDPLVDDLRAEFDQGHFMPWEQIIARIEARSSHSDVSADLRTAAQGLLDALRVEGLVRHGPWSAETGDAIDDLSRALAVPSAGAKTSQGLLDAALAVTGAANLHDLVDAVDALRDVAFAAAEDRRAVPSAGAEAPSKDDTLRTAAHRAYDRWAHYFAADERRDFWNGLCLAMDELGAVLHPERTAALAATDPTPKETL